MPTTKHCLSYILLNMLTCFGNQSRSEIIFTKIYEKHTWKSKESLSGPGSDVKQTITLREQLPTILQRYNIETIFDTPCGDFNWMKLIDFKKYRYVGYDIVKDLIDKNNHLFGSENVHFAYANVITDILPQADIIICRDLLVHLPIKDIFAVLRNFKKSNSKYVLLTTFTRTHKVNRDISMGAWRTINMCLPPFNFPKPIELLNENCTESRGRYKDKCMGLWRLDDINVPLADDSQ